MGIKQLFSVISENAPAAVRTADIKTYFGRKVAIDASMCIYSFLIAVRSDGQQLTSAEGETTSHLMGLFYRTLRMVDYGIKPVYVFDGAPPKLKSGELAKRQQRKAEAAEAEAEAKETGTTEDVEKFSRRGVRVTREHNEECRMLLKLMGMPFLIAPTEAEAQCAALAKDGKVYGAASEDMDTLTFDTPVLLRHMLFSEQRKEPIQEIRLADVLTGLEMPMDQFIDLCILLGCDYVESIKGVGPTTALKLIRDHKSLDVIVPLLRQSPKYTVPEDWPYQDARELFLRPDIKAGNEPECEFKWEEPDVEGLVEFLVRDRGFSEDRVRNGAARLMKHIKTVQQSRLDGFFKTVAKTQEQVDAAKEKQKKAATKSKSKGKPTLGKVSKGGRGRPRR